MIVGYAPGGGADIMGRMIAQRLTESMGQTFIVDNRAGAGGNIGTEHVAKSAPDGYTLLVSSSSFATNVSLYKQPGYKISDFAPIVLFSTTPNLLVTHSAVPASSVKELIALSKRKGAQLNFSSSGNGGSQHLSGELMKLLTGIDMVHIPYKGSAPSLTAVLSGESDLTFINVPAAIPLVRERKIRSLAITSAERSTLLPELPTMIESGIKDFEVTAWFGVLAPAGTPASTISALNASIVKVAGLPETRKRLNLMGAEPVTGTPAEFGAFLQAENERWGKVIAVSGARVQ